MRLDTVGRFVAGLMVAWAAAIVLAGCGEQAAVERDDRVVLATRNLRLLETAMLRFELDHGRCPTEAEGLTALKREPVGLRGYPPGGYIYSLETLIDPWGRPYVYVYRDGARDFSIVSYGADGIEGGAGANADIWSTGQLP